MTAEIVPLVPEPYSDWTEGVLALCDAMPDRHRLPAVLRRLEATADRLMLTSEDLCTFAITVPIGAPAEPIEDGDAAQGEPPVNETAAPSPEQSEWGARLRAGAVAILAPIRAREQEAEAAFAPEDPRRILADTLWGIVATSFVETSDRLGSADPFRRLGARLELWFHPSSVRRWMGVPLGEDTLGIQALLGRLLDRFTPDDQAGVATLRLLRIVAARESLPHSAEGIEALLDIGEAIEGNAARVLQASLLMALMEAIGWDKWQLLHHADGQLAMSIFNRRGEDGGSDLGCTSSLPAWLRQHRRPALLPDIAWFIGDISFHIGDWPETRPPAVLMAMIDILGEQGFAAFPQGLLPLNFYGTYGDPSLPHRIADALPEAHDLMRLLSLRDGDWRDGGEFHPAFWGDPRSADDSTMDLRTACERAIERGDPALADMLIGGWLIHALMVRRSPLPQIPDIARTIRRIPDADRVSVHAAIGLAMAESVDDADAQRRLSPLLSYLPPIPTREPFEPEADLRAHLGDESWGWLSPDEQNALLQNERLFRVLRRLRPEDAEAAGVTALLPKWAAVFEPLLRRALRRCDRRLALDIRARAPLGETLVAMQGAWDMAEREGWPDDDPRRRHLIGSVWFDMIRDLNNANTHWGKHLSGAGSPPSLGEISALRSRVIFGGALRRCLEAAGKPTTP